MSRQENINDDWGLSGYDQSSARNQSADKQVGTSGITTDEWGLPVSDSAAGIRDADREYMDWGLSSAGNANWRDDLTWDSPAEGRKGSPAPGKRRAVNGKWIVLLLAAVAMVTLICILQSGGQYMQPAQVPAVPTATLRPTPQVTNTPRLTPQVTNTPRPTVTPTYTPRPTPQVTNTPRPTPAPTRTPLPTKPAAALFSTYPVSTRYFYHMLTDNEKRLFSEIYDGVAACKSEIVIKGDYTLDEYHRARFVILYDCPELIHLSSEDGYGSTYYYNGDKLTKINVTYSMSKTEFDRNVSQMLEIIRSMRYRSDFGSSDFSKQFVIYRFLIENNDYNLSRPHCGMADSAWLLGYAKCSGYTRALNLGLRYYGIQCCEIRGFTEGSTEGHMWTCVKLDGIWYHCDATWDDPVTSDGSDNDPFGYPVAILPYLNLPDSAMMRARTLNPDTIFPVPQCSSWQHNYYQMMGVRVPAGSSARATIHNALTKAWQDGKDHFTIVFESGSDYNAVMASLVDHLKSWTGGSARYNGCQWIYWDKTYILYVYDIKFR